MPIIDHQDLADIAAQLKVLLPENKAFVVVITTAEAYEPCQVFGNLEGPEQVRLLHEALAALIEPAAQSKVRPHRPN